MSSRMVVISFNSVERFWADGSNPSVNLVHFLISKAWPNTKTSIVKAVRYSSMVLANLLC